MNKQIIIDESNNLIVENSEIQVIDGFPVDTATVYSIQPKQVANHINMFEADMTQAQKTQAALINANITENEGADSD